MLTCLEVIPVDPNVYIVLFPASFSECSLLHFCPPKVVLVWIPVSIHVTLTSYAISNQVQDNRQATVYAPTTNLSH